VYKEIKECKPAENIGQKLRVVCPHCAIETTHEVAAGVECRTEVIDGNFSVTSDNTFQIIRCNGCETHSFRQVQTNSEDYDWDPETGEEEYREWIDLYPARLTGRRPLADTHLLPENVQKLYEETLAALSHELLVLAGIGLRSLVEAICTDRKATGNNLEEKIDSLVSQQVLDRGGAEILHSLRLMGNKSVHEFTPHKVEDLEIATEVVENVLKGVYLLPKRAAHLPQRKPKPSGNNK
jgi:hypothetical protein